MLQTRLSGMDPSTNQEERTIGKCGSTENSGCFYISIHPKRPFHGQNYEMKALIHEKSRFYGQGWHKAGRAALGLSCAACFKELACVFASSGALLIAKIAESLKIWIYDNPQVTLRLLAWIFFSCSHDGHFEQPSWEQTCNTVTSMGITLSSQS